MNDRIPDEEYAKNVKKEFSKLVGKNIKITVFTHDSRRLESYEGKILEVGGEDISFEVSRDDISIPVKEGDNLHLGLTNIHSFVSGDTVKFFARDRRKLNRH